MLYNLVGVLILSMLLPRGIKSLKLPESVVNQLLGSLLSRSPYSITESEKSRVTQVPLTNIALSKANFDDDFSTYLGIPYDVEKNEKIAELIQKLEKYNKENLDLLNMLQLKSQKNRFNYDAGFFDGKNQTIPSLRRFERTYKTIEADPEHFVKNNGKLFDHQINLASVVSENPIEALTRAKGKPIMYERGDS